MDPQPGPVGKVVLAVAYIVVMGVFAWAVRAYGGPWLDANPWPDWANLIFFAVVAAGFVWAVWNHNFRRRRY